MSITHALRVNSVLLLRDSNWVLYSKLIGLRGGLLKGAREGLLRFGRKLGLITGLVGGLLGEIVGLRVG